MTDKEKLEKLAAYLVRRMYAHNQMADIGSTGEIFDEKIENAKYEECKDTLNFIDSMQEEPQVKESAKIQHVDKTCKENGNSLTQEPICDDLEEAIDTYLVTYFGGEKEKQDWPFLKKMAIHFANWKEQQLMAKAVDGVVHRFDGCGVASVHYNDPNGIPMAYFIPSEGLSAGDKVKIITIKED